MSGPQLWANRTLTYSRTALGFGVQGLLGIHWRTRAIAPQVLALALVSWNTSMDVHTVYEDYAK